MPKTWTTMNNTVSYGKVYTDDSGKHMPNVFGDHEPENISYKRLWGKTVDGFFTFNNSESVIMAVQGNIRIIIAHDDAGRYKFEQYYLSELDGKIVRIPEGTTFAIHNLDVGNSAFLVGVDVDNLDVSYTSNSIFNWRKKTP